MTGFDWTLLITDVLDAYTLYIFMHIFYGERRTSRNVELLSYLGYYLSGIPLFFLYGKPIFMLLASLLLFFGISMNYKGSILKAMLNAVLMYAIVACVEIAVSTATGFLQPELLETTTYSSIGGLVVMRIVTFALALYLQAYKNIRKGKTIPPGYWVCLIFVPASTIYCTVVLSQVEGVAMMYITCGIALLIMVDVIIFYLYDNVAENYEMQMTNQLLQQQNRYYNQQFELMEESVAKTSEMRHDMRNHIMVMEHMISDSSSEQFNNYVNRMRQQLDNYKRYATSNNQIFDSILNYKLEEAGHKNIQVSLELAVPEKLNVEAFDMTSLLGNLLDNAIEATQQLEEKRWIHVKIQYHAGVLQIRIANSFDGVVNKKNGTFLTRKENCDEHGIGIRNIYAVVQRYQGTIEMQEIKQEDGTVAEFETNAILYIPDAI